MTRQYVCVMVDVVIIVILSAMLHVKDIVMGIVWHIVQIAIGHC